MSKKTSKKTAKRTSRRSALSSDSIIRTFSAGVHLGRVLSRKGTEVTLAPGSVRVWRWRGANTLNELAAHGCDSASLSNYTRVSDPSPGPVVLTQAIEILATTPIAAERIRKAGWAS